MKGKLKESILEKRNSLPEHEIKKSSEKIKERLFGLEQYRNSKTVMFFVSFNSEVHTHEMIKQALINKNVIVPKVVHGEIEPSVIIDFESLVPSGKFGILEPIEPMKMASKNIDIVLVPGLLFDKEGHRIGYGFGYYDKFLARVPRALKIGLAFDFQVVDKIPKDEHDVPVELIITEKRAVDCRK